MLLRSVVLGSLLVGCGGSAASTTSPSQSASEEAPTPASTGAYRVVQLESFELKSDAKAPAGMQVVEERAPNPTDAQGNRQPVMETTTVEATAVLVDENKDDPSFDKGVDAARAWVQANAVGKKREGCELVRGYHVGTQKVSVAIVLACPVEKLPRITDVGAWETGEDMEGEDHPGGWYVDVTFDAKEGPTSSGQLAIMGRDVVAVVVSKPEMDRSRRSFYIDGYWDRRGAQTKTDSELAKQRAEHKAFVEDVASALAGKKVVGSET